MTDPDLWGAVDFALRASAVTLSFLIAYQLARHYWRQWFGRFGFLVGVGAASYLVCPFLHEITWWAAPVRMMCVINPALLWLFGRALFADGFVPRPLDWAIPGLLFSLWMLRLFLDGFGFPAGAGYLLVGHGLVQLGCAVHLFWRVWADAEDDLVGSRRQFRHVFVVLGGCLLLVIALVELAIADPDEDPVLLMVQALAVWMVTVWASLTLLRMDGFFDRSPRIETGHVPQDVSSNSTVDPDAARIVHIVESQKLYLQTGCTVGRVADEAGLPEYRAREIINRQLGFRNFSDFLNGYRIDEAANRLSDPQLRRMPILTIALDVGFGSIGPFNRAFKSRMGLTPSEYRRSALGSALGA